eukprot:COSAG02_NODE_770_length_17362_cov_42.372125_3_plen_188_part_00
MEGFPPNFSTPPPAKNHAPLRMHTKTKETDGLGQKRRAFRNACRLRLIPAAMSISISSLRQIAPSVPSNPSLLHCLRHTTHKIGRAVLNGREGRKGRGSGGVERHLRPQAATGVAATAQELTPSGRYHAAAAAPARPLPCLRTPPAPACRRDGTHGRPPSRSAGRSYHPAPPQGVGRRSAIIAANEW